MEYVLVLCQSIYFVNMLSRCADRKNIKKLYSHIFNHKNIPM